MNIQQPEPKPKQNAESHALLHEMLRSFSVLARTLNLSHAVRDLSSTRQTVRRHIAILEESLGAPLFDVNDRQYVLTEMGERALPGALDLLARGNAWVRGSWQAYNGLDQISHVQPDGWFMHQKQQPLSLIWDDGSAVLREALSAWTRAQGHLESPELADIRPYLMVYRESPSGWICVEMGEKSFYSVWFGWANARSSIGRQLGEMPGGDEVARMFDIAFREVQSGHGVRLDQVVSAIPRGPGMEASPTAYDRLLMGGRFPDGSFALITVVDRAQRVLIEGLGQTILEEMPKDAVIDF